ncbi:MAG: FHA domain-containing protein [Polyangiaceae bacterium]
MWKLVIEDDEGKRFVVQLTRDDYTIGRKDGNTIRLTERNVSRAHAAIRKRNGSEPTTFVLEDLSSYNGVYVNGLRVLQEQELVHGDLIQIGDYRAVLQDESVSQSAAATAPVDMKSTAPGRGQAPRGQELLERPNRLVMLAGPTPGMEYALDRPRMIVGRAEDAEVSINHNSVSRVHCEIHDLGDGRFEILDKGSSNGVHVNGSELRRGLIEAGDVIELGDVRFKFVGAGQIFRPGSTESQQLTAIGDRTASAVVDGDRRSRWVPMFIFVGIVAAGGVVAWFASNQGSDDPNGPTNRPPAETVELAALATAKTLCDQGDCFAAHGKLIAEIPESSPTRSRPEYADVEARWADAMMKRAESEPDLERRRSLYFQVSRAENVDAARRGIAAQKLAQMDAIPTATPDPTTPPVATTPVLTTTASTPPVPTTPPDRTAMNVPTPVPTPSVAPVRKDPRPPVIAPPVVTTAPTTPPAPSATAAPPPKPVVVSDVDKARQLMIQPGGLPQARALLETKVFGRRGTVEETSVLRQICKDMGDRACMDACKAILQGQ